MPASPREQMDTLLETLLSFGQELLQKHGEFYPYAASIDSSGTPALVGGFTGEDHPPSQDLIDMLYEGLRTQAHAGEIQASGLAADVRVAPPGEEQAGDAIRVELEHADADPVVVFLPYRKKRLGGFEYGELFAAPGEPHVFPD